MKNFGDSGIELQSGYKETIIDHSAIEAVEETLDGQYFDQNRGVSS